MEFSSKTETDQSRRIERVFLGRMLERGWHVKHDPLFQDVTFVSPNGEYQYGPETGTLSRHVDGKVVAWWDVGAWWKWHMQGATPPPL